MQNVAIAIQLERHRRLDGFLSVAPYPYRSDDVSIARVVLVLDPQGLAKALTDALASGKPALINCAIDPKAGTESGHIGNLNPQSSIAPKTLVAVSHAV